MDEQKNMKKLSEFCDYVNVTHLAEDVGVTSLEDLLRGAQEGDEDIKTAIDDLIMVTNSLGVRAAKAWYKGGGANRDERIQTWEKIWERVPKLRLNLEGALMSRVTSKLGRVENRVERELRDGRKVMIVAETEAECEVLEYALKDSKNIFKKAIEWDPEKESTDEVDVLICTEASSEYFYDCAKDRVVIGLINPAGGPMVCQHNSGKRANWVCEVYKNGAKFGCFFFYPCPDVEAWNDEVQTQIELVIGQCKRTTPVNEVPPLVRRYPITLKHTNHGPPVVDRSMMSCTKAFEEATRGLHIKILEYKEMAFHDSPRESHIGKGAFGTVYLATYKDSNVAVKTFVGKDKNSFDSFLREAKILAELKDKVPALVAMHGVLFYPKGNWGIVMEYHPAGNLRKYRTDACGGVSLKLWCGFFKELAHGLAPMLEHVVHRDLKPENILVRVEGGAPRPVIIDLGLAKHYQSLSTAVKGTAAYVAPEVNEGEHISEKSDVFAFGMVFWFALSGLVEDCPSLSYGPKGSERAEAVTAIITQCVRYEPAERPTLLGIESSLTPLC